VSETALDWFRLSPSNPAFVRVDPATGRLVGRADEREQAAYLAQPARHPAFRQPVRVGAFLIDLATGPGAWLGGAGF
jgi:hypothetical protein